MTREEYIEKILKERQKHLNVGEQLDKGYTVSQDTGILGHPTIVENSGNFDEVKIGFSGDLERPLDKSVVLNPRHGVGMEVRSIALDDKLEEQSLQLENGTYIGLDSFVKALEKELAQDEKDTIYVAWKTGKQYSKTALVRDIIKRVTSTHPYLVASIGREHNKYYENLTVVQPGEKKTKKIDLGKFYTRDKKIALGNGKYILAFEIEKALTEYIRMGKIRKEDLAPVSKGPTETVSETEPKPTNPELDPDNLGEAGIPKTPVTPVAPDGSNLTPPKHPVPPVSPTSTGTTTNPINPEPSSEKAGNGENKDEVYELVLRRGKIPSSILKALLPIILALIMLANLLGLDDEKITKFIEEQNVQVPFSVSHMEKMDIEQQYKEHLDSLGVKIGESTAVDSGVQFHESSDYDRGGKNNTGTFGSGLRAAGNYTVESISVILPDGTIVATWQDGTSLESHINEVCAKHNIAITDLSVRVHLTNPVAGWVDFTDLGSKDNSANLRNPSVKLEESEKFKGIIENFNGQTISFQNGEEIVTIKVVDENGNLLAPGTQVIGSDGETYKINELSQEEVTETHEEVVGTKKKLTVSINNIKVEQLLTSLGVAAIGAALGFVLRKNEEEMAELTEEELNYLVNSAKRRFDSDSEFSRAVETLTGKTINPEIVTNLDPAMQTLKDSLIEWDTTIEEVGNMKGR